MSWYSVSAISVSLPRRISWRTLTKTSGPLRPLFSVTPSIVEEHDIVYRNTPAAGERPVAPPRAPVDATWTRTLRPDDVLLFRYSALTFNGHRIHYDRRYVTEVEGYPGLIVHGPLIATLLLDLLRRHLPDAVVARFSFRALSPLFDIAEFTVNGRRDGDSTVALWAANADGGLAMDATATLR